MGLETLETICAKACVLKASLCNLAIMSLVWLSLMVWHSTSSWTRIFGKPAISANFSLNIVAWKYNPEVYLSSYEGDMDFFL